MMNVAWISSEFQKIKIFISKIDKKWYFLTIGFLTLLIITSISVYLLKLRDNNRELSPDKKIECLTDLNFSYSLQLFPNNSFDEDEKLYFSDKDTLYLFRLKSGCITRLSQFPYNVISISKINDEELEITTDSGNQVKIPVENIEIKKKGSGLFERFDYWIFNLQNSSKKEIYLDEINQIYSSKLEHGNELIFGKSITVQLKEFGADRYELIINGKKESAGFITKEQIKKACGVKMSECIKTLTDKYNIFISSPSGRYLSTNEMEMGLIIASDGSNIYLLDDSYFNRNFWVRHFYWTNEDKLVSGDFVNSIQMFEFKDDGKISVQNIKHQSNSTQNFNRLDYFSSDKNYYILEDYSETNNLQLLNFKTGEISTILEVEKIDFKGWGRHNSLFVQDTSLDDKSGFEDVNYRTYNTSSKILFNVAKYNYQLPECSGSSCLPVPKFLLD